MNSHLHTTPTPLGTASRAGIRPLWVASAVWVIASIAGATVAMANVPVGEWSRDVPASTAAPGLESVSPPLNEIAAPRPKPRCASCGVVENIRKLEASPGGVAGGYEFTVRLRNGSTLMTREPHASSWHVGDSIMLMGGATASPPTTKHADLVN